jgi:hypothetical protein
MAGITLAPESSGFRLYLPVILKRVVPHEAHLPLMAWRPFLRVTVLGDEIALVFLSFTQNAFVIG